MRRIGFILAIAILAAATGTARPAGAQDALGSSYQCAADFFAVQAGDDRQTYVVHLRYAQVHLEGTLEAYGRDHVWIAAALGGTSAFSRSRVPEEELVLHTGGPVVGIEFKPARASCSIVGPVRPSSPYDAAPVTSPVIEARDGGAVEPMQCERPFVAAAVLRAVGPDMPVIASQQGIAGVVSVGVELSATSAVERTVVVRSPSTILNTAALNAARKSTYATAVARCRPVPGAYLFNVMFMQQ
jgi:hypothetical protein